MLHKPHRLDVTDDAQFPYRWVPTPVPDAQCFEAIKAGMDKLPPGVKMVLNSGTYFSIIQAAIDIECSE